MTSPTATQHARSTFVVAIVLQAPPGARRRSERPLTIASAPPSPSGASAPIDCPRSSWSMVPLTTNRPSCQVATSTVGGVRAAKSGLPQRFEWIDARRTKRGDQAAAERATEEGQPRRQQGQRVIRGDFEQERLECARYGEGASETKRDAGGDQLCSLTNHHTKDRPLVSADRQSDGELAMTGFHPERDHAVNAECREQCGGGGERNHYARHEAAPSNGGIADLVECPDVLHRNGGVNRPEHALHLPCHRGGLRGGAYDEVLRVGTRLPQRKVHLGLRRRREIGRAQVGHDANDARHLSRRPQGSELPSEWIHVSKVAVHQCLIDDCDGRRIRLVTGVEVPAGHEWYPEQREVSGSGRP